MAHNRDHSLAMASATHLLNEGHIDEPTHRKIHEASRKALGQRLPPFGSLAGAGHYLGAGVGGGDEDA